MKENYNIPKHKLEQLLIIQKSTPLNGNLKK
jgi:hypothetical protein